MTILNAQIGQVGQAGTLPQIIYIDTNDTLAEVTTTGYLNSLASQNFPLSEAMMALVSMKATPSAASSTVGFFDVAKSGDNWSLTANTSTIPLADGKVLVGNSSGVATAVTLSGDVTNTNAGVTAIGANKVLSSMVSPLLVKYAAVPISLADFLAMYTTPVQLVAAAGANTLLVLKQLQIVQTYGSAALASGGVAAVQYDSTANGAGVIASTTLSAATFQATASSVYTMNPGVVVLPFSTTVNKGLYLSNLTGVFTTGTGSSFVAHVWYSVIPTV